MHFSTGRAVTAALMLLLPLAASPAIAQDQGQDVWSGLYVGGNAGGSWGDIKLSRQVTAGNGAVVIPPADVTLINGVTSSGSNKTGFTGGVEGGYNVVSDDWLFGIEGEWVALSVNNRSTNSVTSAITQPIIPPPLVRGDDLLALGLKPGPKIGEILEAVETRQLEGALRDREEALEWLKKEYSLGEDGIGRRPTSNVQRPTSNEEDGEARR